MSSNVLLYNMVNDRSWVAFRGRYSSNESTLGISVNHIEGSENVIYFSLIK